MGKGWFGRRGAEPLAALQPAPRRRQRQQRGRSIPGGCWMRPLSPRRPPEPPAHRAEPLRCAGSTVPAEPSLGRPGGGSLYRERSRRGRWSTQLSIYSSCFNRLLERTRKETWHRPAQPALHFLLMAPALPAEPGSEGVPCWWQQSASPPGWGWGLVARGALLFPAGSCVLSQHPGGVFSSTPAHF